MKHTMTTYKGNKTSPVRVSRVASLALLMGLLLFTTSCEHKDLCYHHPHTAQMRIDVDWSQYGKGTPSGMSVFLYNQEDGALHKTALTNTITHVYVTLTADSYHSLVFNQSSSEFGSVKFEGLDNYHTARVIVDKYESRWYRSRSDASRVVGDSPEWIGADRNHNLVVTQRMMQDAAGYYDHEVIPSRQISEFSIDTLVPRNIVHTLNVKVNMLGIQELRSARASLSGLAEGYVFSTRQPTETDVTQLLENWKLSSDESDTWEGEAPIAGYITTQITFFGMPWGHEATPQENLFDLSLLLVDNKTQVNYPIEVGHLVTRDPEKENTWNLELSIGELPNVVPDGSAGTGFDATVDEWEEGEDVSVGV